METIDDDTVAAAKDFIRRQHSAGTPFFVWMNTTHMHLRTHPKPEGVGQAGRWHSPYHDTMIDHDRHVGELLDVLDELGIAENTIVVYSTDNGPHMNTWPDAVMTQFLATFQEFPPRQRAASFTIDQVVAKLENALTSGR
jgi:arylsulfatase A-like enzyme